MLYTKFHISSRYTLLSTLVRQSCRETRAMRKTYQEHSWCSPRKALLPQLTGTSMIGSCMLLACRCEASGSIRVLDGFLFICWLVDVLMYRISRFHQSSLSRQDSREDMMIVFLTVFNFRMSYSTSAPVLSIAISCSVPTYESRKSSSIAGYRHPEHCGKSMFPG